MLLSAGLEVERIIAAYAIDGMLVDKQLQRGLVAALRAHDGWREIYEDDEALIFLPEAAAPSAGGRQ
jgi:hypothetical protein